MFERIATGLEPERVEQTRRRDETFGHGRSSAPGGAGRKPFDKPALPETKFRDADTYGAMLITATTTGITFEF